MYTGLTMLYIVLELASLDIPAYTVLSNSANRSKFNPSIIHYSLESDLRNNLW